MPHKKQPRSEGLRASADDTVDIRALRGSKRDVARVTFADRAWAIRKDLDKVDETGSRVWNPFRLAKYWGLALDTVLTHCYYTEIDKRIRDAVDLSDIALKLCVTGADCVCYGFDEYGKRYLLQPDQQFEIYCKLREAFEGADIRDNPITRAIVGKLKSQVLRGTKYAIERKSSRRQSRHLQASLAAARKLGLIVKDSFIVDEGKGDEVEERVVSADPAPPTAKWPDITKMSEGEKTRRAAEIEDLLTRHGGNAAKAAKELGVPRTTLAARMKKLGLQ